MRNSNIRKNISKKLNISFKKCLLFLNDFKLLKINRIKCFNIHYNSQKSNKLYRI